MRRLFLVAAAAALVATPAMAAPANGGASRAVQTDVRADRAAKARVANRASTPIGKAEKLGSGSGILIGLLIAGGIGAVAATTSSGSPASP